VPGKIIVINHNNSANQVVHIARHAERKEGEEGASAADNALA
jgi:hypothetical protein